MSLKVMIKTNNEKRNDQKLSFNRASVFATNN